MKIALVARGVYPFDFGGREIRIYQLAKFFAKKHEVEIFVPQKNFTYPSEYENFHICSVRVPISDPRLLNFGNQLFFAMKISKILSEKRYDVVDLLFYSFPFKKNCKVVATLMATVSMWKDVPGFRKLYNMLPTTIQFWLNHVKVCFADKIICVSDSSREEAIKFYSVPANEIITIKNGVDITLFNPSVKTDVRERFGIDKNEFLVLYAGRLVYEKGIQDLIKVVKELSKSYEIRLMIVGEGSYKRKLRKIAGEETIFVPPQTYESMPKFYRAADVFVLPSYWEVQPLGCIEAMACGTPVIATWVGGIPEIIKDHQTGILIPPKNLIELKKALLKIYKNDSLRKRISKNAFRFARLRTWTKIAQETLWVYEEP